MREYNVVNMSLDKKDLEQIDKKFKRHTGFLYEKFQDDIKTLAEGIGINKEKIESNADKIDAVFEEVGEIREDMEIVKQDISFIKQELRKKADQEDLDALEKRVILLEKKVSRT